MPSYRVTWEIDIDADSPLEAAKQAITILRDEDSTATIFTVVADGSTTFVDTGTEMTTQTTMRELMRRIAQGDP